MLSTTHNSLRLSATEVGLQSIGLGKEKHGFRDSKECLGVELGVEHDEESGGMLLVEGQGEVRCLYDELGEMRRALELERERVAKMDGDEERDRSGSLERERLERLERERLERESSGKEWEQRRRYFDAKMKEFLSKKRASKQDNA